MPVRERGGEESVVLIHARYFSMHSVGRMVDFCSRLTSNAKSAWPRLSYGLSLGMWFASSWPRPHMSAQSRAFFSLSDT